MRKVSKSKLLYDEQLVLIKGFLYLKKLIVFPESKFMFELSKKKI